MMTKHGIALRFERAAGEALREPAGLNFANLNLYSGMKSTYYM